MTRNPQSAKIVCHSDHLNTINTYCSEVIQLISRPTPPPPAHTIPTQYTRAHTPSRTHSPTHTHTHTHTRARARARTHLCVLDSSMSDRHSSCVISSLPHHPLPHTRYQHHAHAHTHSLTHSHTHSLTHSLTHSPLCVLDSSMSERHSSWVSRSPHTEPGLLSSCQGGSTRCVCVRE